MIGQVWYSACFRPNPATFVLAAEKQSTHHLLTVNTKVLIKTTYPLVIPKHALG